MASLRRVSVVALVLVLVVLAPIPLLAQGASSVSFRPTREWLTDVALGNVPGWSLVHKFGSGTATTTIAPITQSGVYQTPTTAQALEFVSSSLNDDAVGSGAQEVTIIGLDSTWAVVTQVLATDGTTPVPLPTNLIRLYRWYVSASGTYATSAAASHDGTLTIRGAGAGATWSVIGLAAGQLGVGQSLIGAITVPAGVEAYLVSFTITADGTKSADVYLFHRCSADDVVTPYSGMRVTREIVGLTSSPYPSDPDPDGPFLGPCDLGFMAAVAATSASVAVEFELLYHDLE